MDFLEKSFASASETSKLLITLATGIIAFTVALVNVKVGESMALAPAETLQWFLLAGCWLSLIASIGCGVWTQLGITHVLADADDKNRRPSTWDRVVRIPFLIQILSFVTAMAVLLIYAAVKIS